MRDRVIQLLARKLAGEATAEELEELDRLLMADPECVYYTELLSHLWEGKEAAGDDVPELSYWKHKERHQPEFRSGYPDSPRRRRTRFSLHPKRTQGVLLLALLVMIAGSMWIFLKPAHHAQKIVSNRQVAVKLGDRQHLVLPDGTRVWLNAGSTLKYDTAMNRQDTRTVLLSGEAFFDVAKNREKPFIIHTSKIAIRVLGTAFNVKAYPNERTTETTLLRGSIELTVNKKPYQKIVLKPKEKFLLIDDQPVVAHPSQVSATDKSSVLSGAKTDDAVKSERLVVQDLQPVSINDREYVQETSWMNDNLVFSNETLEELAPQLERWFNVRIDIRDDAAKNCHFTGVFHKETIDQAMAAMQIIKPFKYKISDNHVLIY